MQVQYKSFELNSESLSKERIFSGYASTWDLDQGGDIIQKGAFSKTISERFDRVKVLFEHKHTIGKPVDMGEDNRGMKVSGKISKTRLGDDVVTLIEDGVIDQMSIGFSIPQGKSNTKNGARIITEVKLFEFSPVTFPMNESAYIESIKSATQAIKEGSLSQSDFIQLKDLLSDLSTLIISMKPPSTSKGMDKPSITEAKQLAECLKQLKL